MASEISSCYIIGLALKRNQPNNTDENFFFLISLMALGSSSISVTLVLSCSFSPNHCDLLSFGLVLTTLLQVLDFTFALLSASHFSPCPGKSFFFCPAPAWKLHEDPGPCLFICILVAPVCDKDAGQFAKTLSANFYSKGIWFFYKPMQVILGARSRLSWTWIWHFTASSVLPNGLISYTPPASFCSFSPSVGTSCHQYPRRS